MNRDRIIMILCAQDYPDYMLEQTADKVERMDERIKNVFEEWVENGTIPTLEIEGWNYNSLISKFKMRPVAAFLALDWLMRDPEKASKALKRGIR